MPISLVADALLPLKQGKAPRIRSLEIEFTSVPLAKARTGMGLPATWTSQLEQLGGDRRQVLSVRRTMPRSHAHSVLREGDLVLAVEGQPVVTSRQVEVAVVYGRTDGSGSGSGGRGRSASFGIGPSSLMMDVATGTAGANVSADGEGAEASTPEGLLAAVDPAAAAAAEASVGQPSQAQAASRPRAGSQSNPIKPINVTILRDTQEMTVQVIPSLLSGSGTERLLVWCGMLLQHAHEQVEALGFVPPTSGVYISRWSYGSPAHKAGLRATNWITHVNDTATPDLDSLLSAVAGIGDGADVRIRCTDLADRKRVFTLSTDLTYWPTVELRRDSGAVIAALGEANKAEGGGTDSNSTRDGGRGSHADWHLIRHTRLQAAQLLQATAS